MFIDCPKCECSNDLCNQELPDRACDDAEMECRYCEHVFKVGWYATAEVRDPMLNT